MEISNEAFVKAWESLDKKRRWAKKLYAGRVVAEPAAQIVYFILFSGFSIAQLLTRGGKLVTQFLEKFPEAIAFWNEKLAPFFGRPINTWQDALTIWASIILISVAVAVVFALPVMLLYYPRKKQLPASPEIYRDSLLACYREYADYHRRFRDNTRGFCCTLYGITALAFVTGFLMNLNQIRQYQNFIETTATKLSFIMGFSALGLIIAYLVLNLPLHWFLRYGMRNYIPKELRNSLDSFLNAAEDEQEVPVMLYS